MKCSVTGIHELLVKSRTPQGGFDTMMVFGFATKWKVLLRLLPESVVNFAAGMWQLNSQTNAMALMDLGGSLSKPCHIQFGEEWIIKT
jgi:hypothetical protein